MPPLSQPGQEPRRPAVPRRSPLRALASRTRALLRRTPLRKVRKARQARERGAMRHPQMLSFGFGGAMPHHPTRHRNLPAMLLSRPIQLTFAFFLVMTLLAAGLLSLPISSRQNGWTDLPTAFFTAASAMTTCGISVVNTSAYWTLFGQAVILLAIQMGGLGVITFASIVTLTVSRRLKVTQRLLTANELGTNKLSEVKSVIGIVLITSLTVETVSFLLLFPSLLGTNKGDVGTSMWEALFFAISSYNNTGFTPDSAGLHINSWGVGLPILGGAFIGTLGFPVLLNIARSIKHHQRPRRWTLHTKLTLTATFALVALSVVWFLLVERNNPSLFKDSTISQQMRMALTVAVVPRSAGFDVSWVPQVSEPTKVFMSLIMFVGGGAASTAGGIRVTTFAVLILVTVSQFRQRRDVTVFGRRLHRQTVSIAVTVTMTFATILFAATLALMMVTGRDLTDSLFEACSALSLAGYTLGVADPDNPATLAILATLSFIGRLGPMTIAYMISKPKKPQATRCPAENIVVG